VLEWLKGVITMEWDWGNTVFAMSALVGLLAGVIQFVELARSEQSVPAVPGAGAAVNRGWGEAE